MSEPAWEGAGWLVPRALPTMLAHQPQTQGSHLGPSDRHLPVEPTAKRERLQPKKNASIKEACVGDFPGGAVDKNLPANAGRMGSIPSLGGSHRTQSS